jgi:hypothetical protein
VGDFLLVCCGGIIFLMIGIASGPRNEAIIVPMAILVKEVEKEVSMASKSIPKPHAIDYRQNCVYTQQYQTLRAIPVEQE